MKVDWAQLDRPVYNFTPRPSQRRFVDSKARIRAFVAANRTGKSATGAYDTARKVLLTKPPRKNCPFWIISETYEMVCNVAWGERLAPFIEQSDIAWISWMNKARNWPSAIGLKSGWTLELKSWAQGRGTFQARSIGGAWFDEQFPEPIFHETFARTSDHNAPIIITLTPIEPDAFLEERYERPPHGWEFFSMDLEENRKSRGGYLSDDWVDAFIADTPLEFRDVRIHGKFATFEGAVFKDWRRDIHVIDAFPDNTPPDSGTIYRGIDFGFANPFCCLWAHLSHDDVLTFFDEHYEARRFIEYHGAAINRRKRYNQGIATTLADPEDPEARGKLDEMGIFNECGPNAINRGIEAIMHRMKLMGNGKPRLQVTRNCVNLIREIPRYHWPENTSENRDPKDTPVDKDNHAISAMRYIVYYLHLNGGGYLPPERIEGSGEFARSYSRVIG